MVPLMKVAIPHWQGRVSPVFDVAMNLLVAEIEQGVELGREQAVLTAMDPVRRAQQVIQTGATVLICGAISWPMEAAITSEGITLYPQVCGAVEEVLAAFRKGRLTEEAFIMPGCCGRRWRNRRRGARRQMGAIRKEAVDEDSPHDPGA